MLRTIRVWADAVERYPTAFNFLVEDRLSDLLAATLNAALPGANREVYSRGGKADIFIRAEALSSGAGPAKVFICECKWWPGPARVDRALSQLFGYLETKDTAAALVFFVRLRDPRQARPAAVQRLMKRPGTLNVADPPVADWPVLRFAVDGRTVSVCLVFIDVPKTR